MPKKWIISLIGFVLLGQTWAANASLPVGARAPLFSTSSAKAGEEFGFNLAAALAKGPVVIYFTPKPSLEDVLWKQMRLLMPYLNFLR